jgi:hypothetical protein
MQVTGRRTVAVSRGGRRCHRRSGCRTEHAAGSLVAISPVRVARVVQDRGRNSSAISGTRPGLPGGCRMGFGDLRWDFLVRLGWSRGGTQIALAVPFRGWWLTYSAAAAYFRVPMRCPPRQSTPPTQAIRRSRGLCLGTRPRAPLDLRRFVRPAFRITR